MMIKEKTEGHEAQDGPVKDSEALAEKLTILGEEVREPQDKLETFDNPSTRDYTITIETDEFTCLCPKTGQPDFARIEIDYRPDARCVESKSFKLYLWSFRDKGIFHEACAAQILEDFVAAVDPKYVSVTMRYGRRGGLDFTVSVDHHKEFNPSGE